MEALWAIASLVFTVVGLGVLHFVILLPPARQGSSNEVIRQIAACTGFILLATAVVYAERTGSLSTQIFCYSLQVPAALISLLLGFFPQRKWKIEFKRVDTSSFDKFKPPPS